MRYMGCGDGPRSASYYTTESETFVSNQAQNMPRRKWRENFEVSATALTKRVSTGVAGHILVTWSVFVAATVNRTVMESRTQMARPRPRPRTYSINPKVCAMATFPCGGTSCQRARAGTPGSWQKRITSVVTSCQEWERTDTYNGLCTNHKNFLRCGVSTPMCHWKFRKAKAKAKDLKMCSQGPSRPRTCPRGLHHWNRIEAKSFVETRNETVLQNTTANKRNKTHQRMEFKTAHAHNRFFSCRIYTVIKLVIDNVARNRRFSPPNN